MLKIFLFLQGKESSALQRTSLNNMYLYKIQTKIAPEPWEAMRCMRLPSLYHTHFGKWSNKHFKCETLYFLMSCIIIKKERVKAKTKNKTFFVTVYFVQESYR